MKLVMRALSACILTLALPAAAFAAVPENDLPPGIEVTALPFTHSTDTALAEIHAMEPNSTCILLGGDSVWYHFTAADDQLLTVDTIGSEFDTVIDVFEGTLSANPDDPFDALTIAGCNDNHGASLQSRLTFAVTAGETYLIRVSSSLTGSGGPLTLKLAVAGPGETPAPVPKVPENDLPPGIEVTALPFTHSTDTELADIHGIEPNSTCILLGNNSVWYNYTAAADGLLVADTIGSDFDTVIDVFQGTLSATPGDPFDALTVVGCNDNHGASLQSRLVVAVTTGESYLIRVNNTLDGTGGSLTLKLAVAGAGETPAPVPKVPENDLPPGIEIIALPFTHSTDTTLADIHAMEPSATCILSGGDSVWYNFTAADDQLLVVDTIGSEFDTVVDVFEGTLSANPDDPFDALTNVGCNDNHGSSLQSRLTFAVTAGETYLIRVSTPLHGSSGPLTLNLAVVGAGETPDPVPTPPATDRIDSAAQVESGPPSLAFVGLVAGLLAVGLMLALPRRRSSEARSRR